MASNSYGYGGYQEPNKSQGYGYSGYGYADEKDAVKSAKDEKPLKKQEPPKAFKPQEAPRPPPAKKRKSHSRYMPFLIILIVLTLGMVFIGLVMTVVAHWPGYSAIGGNPLEVAGPVLLSFGIFGFVACLIIVFLLKSSERMTYTKRFTKLANSARMATMQQNVSMMQSSYMAQQNRMPSMGSIGMHESQTMLGVPQTPSAYTDEDVDPSYSQHLEGYSRASETSIDKVNLADTDPNAPGVVPTPVRPSSRKTKRQEALGEGGYDEGTGDAEGQKKKHRHRRHQDGEQGGEEDPQRPKRKSKKTPGAEGQLRIDIKAQPGTSVHIAPGANYQQPGANATISSETEI